MTTQEDNLIEKGYKYTGVYSHDKEEVKQRAKEERKKGNFAQVVRIPSNPY